MADILDCPRAYSIGQRDYNPELARRLLVKLDGKPQTRVLAYDADAGTVTRIVTNEDGVMQIDHEADAVKRETLTGHVTVEWRG